MQHIRHTLLSTIATYLAVATMAQTRPVDYRLSLRASITADEMQRVVMCSDETKCTAQLIIHDELISFRQKKSTVKNKELLWKELKTATMDSIATILTDAESRRLLLVREYYIQNTPRRMQQNRRLRRMERKTHSGKPLQINIDPTRNTNQ